MDNSTGHGVDHLAPPSVLNGNEGYATPTPYGTSIPGTPNEEGIHFTPKRAMASFENLVAMANYQEGMLRLIL
jgi:hypothetical protein